MTLLMEKERLQTRLNEYSKHGNEYKSKFRELKHSMTEKYRYYRETMEQKDRDLKSA